VGDEEQGDAGAQQVLFKPADRFDVEVVGRLVEQQQIGLAGKRPGEQHPPFHAAGESDEGPIRLQLEAGQHLLDALLQRPAAGGVEGVLGDEQFRQQALLAAHLQLPAEGVVTAERLPRCSEAAGHHFEDRSLQLLRHVLRQARHLQPLLPVDDAGIRQYFACHQGEQGRLAGAVAPQQADALSPFNLQAGSVEQGGAAEGEGDVAKAQ